VIEWVSAGQQNPVPCIAHRGQAKCWCTYTISVTSATQQCYTTVLHNWVTQLGHTTGLHTEVKEAHCHVSNSFHITNHTSNMQLHDVTCYSMVCGNDRTQVKEAHCYASNSARFTKRTFLRQ
jgi:hypothetical protein